MGSPRTNGFSEVGSKSFILLNIESLHQEGEVLCSPFGDIMPNVLSDGGSILSDNETCTFRSTTRKFDAPPPRRRTRTHRGSDKLSWQRERRRK